MACLNADNVVDISLCEERIKEFTFIGLLENIDKDIIIINDLLNDYYKCDYTIDVPHKNATKNVSIKYHLALKKRVEDFCSNDMFFYNMVKEYRQI